MKIKINKTIRDSDNHSRKMKMNDENDRMMNMRIDINHDA